MRYPLYILLMQCILTIACNNDKPADTVPLPEPTPQPSPAPAQKESDGTTVKVDENGISYENKQGDKKDELKISEDSSRIEIKRK
jgi:hypothetical protein